jgi:lysophospholipase L1-like esterase
MRGLLALIITGLIIGGIFQAGAGYRAYLAIQDVARSVEQEEVPHNDPWGRNMLVLGDSFALGAGAKDPAKDSIASRIAAARQIANVENYAEPGAGAADMASQAERAERTHYDVIVIQVGANDLLLFKSPEAVVKKLEPVLQAVAASSAKAYFLSFGDIAEPFPWPLSDWYHQKTLRYHHDLKALADRTGVTYVNLYDSPDKNPFLLESERYLARDRFHPSTEGYQLWYEKLVQAF